MLSIRTLAFKTFNKLKFLYKSKNALQELIPAGPYCYGEKGACPYFESFKKGRYPEFGCWCSFCNDNDMLLLWDMCKMCGVKEYEDN